MSREFLKKLSRGQVPEVYRGVVAASLGDGRYRISCSDGSTIVATVAANVVYGRGDAVRLRGTEILGLVKSAKNIKKYEV